MHQFLAPFLSAASFAASRITKCLALLAVSVAPAIAQAQPSPGGTITVIRKGNNGVPLTSSSTRVYLEVWDKATKRLISKTPYPNSASLPHLAFTLSGNDRFDGRLTASADGQYLVCAGYDTPAGLANVATSNVTRCIARMDLTGTIDTTTGLGSAYSGAAIYSAASEDGTSFYAAGSSGGVTYATLGGGVVTQINTAAPTSLRSVNIFGGQLYASAAASSFFGVGTVGTNLPTTGGQTLSLLPGFPNVGPTSSNDFYFADATTLYVADDRPQAAGGGIHKWTFDNSTGSWSFQYVLTVSATDGCLAVSGFNNCGTTELVATTAPASATAPNQLICMADVGLASVPILITTSAADTVFRGVRYIPFPSTFVVVGVGSSTSAGVPTIASIGSPSVGSSSWGLLSTNWPPFTIGVMALTIGPLGPGIPIPGAQPGALLYIGLPETTSAVTLSDIGGNASQIVPLPCLPVLAGLAVGGQWFVLDPLLPTPLPLATSPGALIQIGN